MSASLTERVHAAAKPYLTGWRYPPQKTTGRFVAYAWPRGLRGPAVARSQDERVIDCSSLTASILMRVYSSAKWDAAAYASLQVFDSKRLDSPIGAVVRMGVGVAVSAFTAEDWFLVQAWRSGSQVICHIQRLAKTRLRRMIDKMTYTVRRDFSLRLSEALRAASEL
jgi:hypothetical protein